jgi:hypothetical protein
MGAIHEIDNHAERIKAVANDYLTSGKNQKVLIVTPTHLEGEQVTQEIRSQLKGQQVLGKTEKQFTSLRNLQYTEAEKSNPENYRAGQVLSFHQNIKGVLAGSKLTIVTTSDNIIHAHDAAGRDYQVSITKAGSYNVFEPMKIEICKGDKIRITGNGRTEDGKHLFNGNTYGVNGFDKQGNIKLSNGSLLDKDYGHFTQGYVITSHSSQGKTADKVIISQSSMTFRAASMEQFYVSVSRGRRNISIYTDDKTSLMEAISKSSQRLSATELVNNHHAEIIKQTQQRIRSYSINAPNKHYELPRTYKTNIQGKGR